MALNDILKHMPSMGNEFAEFEMPHELDFMNFQQHVLAVPPYKNVSLANFSESSSLDVTCLHF